MDDFGDSTPITLDDFINWPFEDSEEQELQIGSPGDEPLLHEMAREGKTDVLQEALEMGGDLTEEDEKGRTPLEAAAAGGSPEAIRLLLEAGADPTKRDDEGKRALALAADSGSLEATERLLDAGVEATYHREGATNEGSGADGKRRSLVFPAVEGGSVETLRLVLEEGAKADVTGDLNRTPLHYAAEKSGPKTRLLIEAGVPVGPIDDYGRPPLAFAAGGGQTGAMRALLSAGADPMHTDPGGDTLLHHAVSSGKEEPLKILIEHGVDVNRADEWGITPLHKAAKIAEFGPARTLLEAGADPLKTNNDGETPTQIDVGMRFPSEAEKINALIHSYIRE